MSNDIERLNYYERQYLQSSDFTDEQTYHLEMRRRLNLALHLWGIVTGLELLQGEVIQGATSQFYVSEGMAIDAYGREIIVSAKHLLSGDLSTNRITSAGTYSVWIGYTRQQTTPPQAGFQACNMTNQYTRWQESFQIIISSLSANPNPSEDPDSFGDLSDDPTNNPWLIHLGTINVDQTLAIASVKNDHRLYVGLRTQRILAPRNAIAEFNLLNANTALNPLTSIKVRDNLFLEQNLIAGTDFAIDQTKIQPTPSGTFPKPTGNLKIAGDVFLQGNLYTQSDPAQPDLWQNLATCVQNLVPEVHVGVAPISFTEQSTTATAAASTDVPITTQLAQFDASKTAIITSIAKLVWVAGTAPTTLTGLQIDAYPGAFALVSGKNYTVSVTCSVAPALPISGSASFQSPLDSVSISYVVILYPKTS
jgi:hypothetical protein